MGLHHKLCHTLGGAYSLPHAQTHAAILPHSFAFNGMACPKAVGQLADIFGGDPATGLFDFIEALGLTTGLRNLGLPEAEIVQAAKLSCVKPYANPRPFNEKIIAGILWRAWCGDRTYMGVS